jgi:hypothetical protein
MLRGQGIASALKQSAEENVLSEGRKGSENKNVGSQSLFLCWHFSCDLF